MLKNKRMLTSLNGGVCDIYRENTLPSSFGAKVNATTYEQLEFIARLHYAPATVRDEDIESAKRQGVALSMKIRCYEHSKVQPKHKAVIDNTLYDIVTIDRDDPFMWVSLSGGEPIEHS